MLIAGEMEALLSELQSWVAAHPTLPPAIEKIILQRFLYTMLGDLAATKRLIETNYAMRNKYAQIFLDRDPQDKDAQQLLQVADLIPLPGLTPQKNKLLFYRLVDYDAEKFNLTAGIKVFFMIADCRFVTQEDDGCDDGATASDGEIPIFDMAGYSLKHLRKTVFSSLRIYMKFVQEAHPVRLKEIHVLNCPSYLDKVLTVVKPFIRSDVFKLIHFHLPNATTPYDYFPRDMLPDEYGGKAGKLSDLKQRWLQVLHDKRDYLMDGNQWRLRAAKPVNAAKNCSTTAHNDVSANFRALNID